MCIKTLDYDSFLYVNLVKVRLFDVHKWYYLPSKVETLFLDNVKIIIILKPYKIEGCAVNLVKYVDYFYTFDH